MDFINQARNLADTLKDKAQEAATNTAKGIEEVVDGIKNTTVEITTSSINVVTDLSATAQQGFQAVLHLQGYSCLDWLHTSTFNAIAAGVFRSRIEF